MTPKPSSDTGFQIVTTAEPGYDAFRIMVPMTTVRPGSAVAAGTTFTNAAVPFKHRAAEGWGDYVAGRRAVADSGYLWQNFVRALPTTPTVAEGEFHRTFGRTFVHSYDDLIANTRPDRGDVIEVALGQTVMTTWDGASSANMTVWDGAADAGSLLTYDSRVVLDCTENDLGQGLCSVQVRTVQTAEVTITEDSGADPETGELLTTMTTHTLTSTRPTGTATDSAGYRTLVTKQEHNWWVSTRSKAITGPINEASALTETKTERSPILWPDVLVGWQWIYAVNASETNIAKLLSYTMKAAYAGDVKVHYRKWWQLTEPTPREPVEMLTGGINIPRTWSADISIPDCLHAVFSVSEPLFVRDTLTGPLLEREVTSTVPATPLTDWPDTVVKMDVQREEGGFRCIERTIEKPQSIVTGVSLTQTGWTPLSGTGFEGYA